METMRVRAVAGRRVQALHDDGRLMFGAPFVGYDTTGPSAKPLPEGVVVPKTSHWIRRVNDGDLELLTEAKPSADAPMSASKAAAK